MIKIINNDLLLNDGTYYDLSKSNKKRVMQGLNRQLEEGSLTKEEYVKCIDLLNSTTTQQLLEVAIEHYGISDIITKMLSQRRDKEVVEEQKKLYKSYREGNNVLSICS
ncbi:hypothetical protein ACQPUZ_04620 [Clostridium tertium]